MVFGLFESKSEKLTKKYFKISRELFAASRRVLNNPNSEWWKKYYCETMRHLKEIGEDIQREMGREYMINLEKMIELEYKKSIYFLSKDENANFNILIDEYITRNKIEI
jgi:hypothetical protein